MVSDVRHLGSSRSDVVCTYLLLGGGGGLLLGLAPWLATWLAEVPVVPFRPALDWVGSFDDPWTWVVRPLVGLALGLAGAWLVLYQEYRLEVGPEQVVVAHGEDRRHVERSAIVGVHRDGKRIVIDGTGGRRLFEQKVEASRTAVREAFTAHRYPYESQ